MFLQNLVIWCDWSCCFYFLSMVFMGWGKEALGCRKVQPKRHNLLVPSWSITLATWKNLCNTWLFPSTTCIVPFYFFGLSVNQFQCTLILLEEVSQFVNEPPASDSDLVRAHHPQVISGGLLLRTWQARECLATHLRTSASLRVQRQGYGDRKYGSNHHLSYDIFIMYPSASLFK